MVQSCQPDKLALQPCDVGGLIEATAKGSISGAMESVILEKRKKKNHYLSSSVLCQELMPMQCVELWIDAVAATLSILQGNS